MQISLYPFISSIVELSDVPTNVISLEVTYDPPNYLDDLFNKAEICFPDNVKRAVIKRKAAYLAGRFAAKLCLERLTVTAQDITVGNHREPIWPAEIVGSISHTANHATVVVSRKCYYESIGVDIERWLQAVDAKKISRSALRPNERALQVKSGFSYEEFTTLVFSAKESLFKALFPVTRSYFNFLNTEIISMDQTAKTLNLALTNTLEHLPSGGIYTLKYSTKPFGIHTVLYLEAIS